MKKTKKKSKNPKSTRNSSTIKGKNLSEKENYKQFYEGSLPKGCELCLKGAKVVIFFGGECTRPEHCCWYCPISEERKNPNAYFVDELIYESDETIFEEIEAIGAKGLSFTGGDPLITLRVP